MFFLRLRILGCTSLLITQETKESSSWKMFLRTWTKGLEQPFFRRTFRIQSIDIKSKAEI